MDVFGFAMVVGLSGTALATGLGALNAASDFGWYRGAAHASGVEKVRRNSGRFWRYSIVGMSLALTFAFAAGRASAHSWYDSACCSGMDCAPVSASTIRATADGWLIHLEVGDHPMVKRPITKLLPYGDWHVRKSKDGDFHACVLPQAQIVMCIYVPEFAA